MGRTMPGAYGAEMRELLPADARALDEEQWCSVELVKQGVWHNITFRPCLGSWRTMRPARPMLARFIRMAGSGRLFDVRGPHPSQRFGIIHH